MINFILTLQKNIKKIFEANAYCLCCELGREGKNSALSSASILFNNGILE